MCIISKPVEKVSQTKILVGPDKKLQNQITIYSNQVNNISNSNAMILPTPHPSTVKFIDLSKYKDLFIDIDKVFYKEEKQSTNNLRSSYSKNSSTLQVFNVGSYKVSLAMNIEDLHKVDKNEFELSTGCYDLLKSSYESTFGFIICKLAKGSEYYHPFGYSHKLINPKQLFIPTKHYHDNKISFIYDSSNIDSYPMFSIFTPLKSQDEADDWSHEIYLYNCTSPQIKSMSHNNYQWNGKNPLINSSDKINFDFDKLSHFEKHKIEGTHNNIDLIVDLVVNLVKKDKYFFNQILNQFLNK
jgi:hypothetical protein